jgi:hypothetical protein
MTNRVVSPKLNYMSKVRTFETGATRGSDIGKPDYEGFLSPLVLERFAQHMQKNAKQPDGKYRASDNWQLGISQDVYIKSAFRHFINIWKVHRGYSTRESIETSLCALLFNIMGYLHEELKKNNNK